MPSLNSVPNCRFTSAYMKSGVSTPLLRPSLIEIEGGRMLDTERRIGRTLIFKSAQPRQHSPMYFFANNLVKIIVDMFYLCVI